LAAADAVGLLVVDHVASPRGLGLGSECPDRELYLVMDNYLAHIRVEIRAFINGCNQR
jgi:hypothetical protein